MWTKPLSWKDIQEDVSTSWWHATSFSPKCWFASQSIPTCQDTIKSHKAVLRKCRKLEDVLRGTETCQVMWDLTHSDSLRTPKWQWWVVVARSDVGALSHSPTSRAQLSRAYREGQAALLLTWLRTWAEGGLMNHWRTSVHSLGWVLNTTPKHAEG